VLIASRFASQDISVGHMLRLQTNQRVPADMLLLRTATSTGMVFLRTDQLDGETDWKLRLAVPSCAAGIRDCRP